MKFLQKYKIWKSILVLYIFLILLGLTGCKSTKQCAQHQMNYQKIDPTCQTPGYERYWCSKCKYEEIKNKVSPVDHKYSKRSTRIKTCYYSVTEACVWCGAVGKEYEESTHNWEYLRKESGEKYRHCKICNDYFYDDEYTYKQVNLCIETPTPIEYYNKIQVRYVLATENLYIKFLNISSTEYFLQDIVFIFKDREIHYRDENYNFEFNGVRKNWFEPIDGKHMSNGVYQAKHSGLNLKDIKLDTSFWLDWSAEYPNIYDVVTIKFIFVD